MSATTYLRYTARKYNYFELREDQRHCPLCKHHYDRWLDDGIKMPVRVAGCEHVVCEPCLRQHVIAQRQDSHKCPVCPTLLFLPDYQIAEEELQSNHNGEREHAAEWDDGMQLLRNIHFMRERNGKRKSGEVSGFRTVDRFMDKIEAVNDRLGCVPLEQCSQIMSSDPHAAQLFDETFLKFEEEEFHIKFDIRELSSDGVSLGTEMLREIVTAQTAEEKVIEGVLDDEQPAPDAGLLAAHGFAREESQVALDAMMTEENMSVIEDPGYDGDTDALYSVRLKRETKQKRKHKVSSQAVALDAPGQDSERRCILM